MSTYYSDLDKVLASSEAIMEKFMDEVAPKIRNQTKTGLASWGISNLRRIPPSCLTTKDERLVHQFVLENNL